MLIVQIIHFVGAELGECKEDKEEEEEQEDEEDSIYAKYNTETTLFADRALMVMAKSMVKSRILDRNVRVGMKMATEQYMGKLSVSSYRWLAELLPNAAKVPSPTVSPSLLEKVTTLFKQFLFLFW